MGNEVIRGMHMEDFESVEEKVIYNKLKVEDKKYQSIKVKTNEEINSNEIDAHFNEIHNQIMVLNKTRENFAFRTILSHRKIMGRCIVFFKRAIRKLLKWYIEPICFQQTAFNNAITSIVGRMTELLQSYKKNKEEIEQLKNQVKELMRKIDDEKNYLKNMQNDWINCIENINLVEKKYLESMKYIKTLEEKWKENMNCTRGIEEEYKVYLIEYIKTFEGKWKESIEHRKLYQLLMEENRESVSQVKEQLNFLSNEIIAVNADFKRLRSCELGIFDEKENAWDMDSFSQSGEDSICHYILIMLGFNLRECTYLDLGANHAKKLSNTYFLYQKGARGILVEANPQLIPELKFYRHGDLILNNCIAPISGKKVNFYIMSGDGLSTCNLQAAEGNIAINKSLKIVDSVEIETITVNEIIETYLRKSPTILNIDIEGEEIKILESINFSKYRPLLIIIEMIEYKPFLTVNGKKQEIVDILEQRNYIEYAFTGINSIFIDELQIQEVL